MPWLLYVFFGLILAMGCAVFWLTLRAKRGRAWIWMGVALVGAAGLVSVGSGTYRPGWRSFAMAAVFVLFAADAIAQHVESRRSGSPRRVHLWLCVAWLTAAALEVADVADWT